MKKWIFVIVPAVAMGIFLVFYSSFHSAMELRQAEYEAEQDRLEAIRIAEDQRKATEAANSLRRAEEQKARDDAQKEAARLATYNSTMQQIRDSIAVQEANIASRELEISTLESTIDAHQAEKDALQAQLLDLQKTVEGAKIELRNAELEAQRTLAMITSVELNSDMLDAPVFPGRGGRGGRGGPAGPAGGGGGRGGPGGGPGGGARGGPPPQ